MERKNKAGKPPTSSRPMPIQQATVVNIGADMSFNVIGMSNKENHQARALGSGLKDLMRAKNQSAAQFAGKNRNQSVGAPVKSIPQQNSISLQNNGKRIISSSGNNSLVRQSSARGANNHSAQRQSIAPAEEEKKAGGIFAKKPSDKFSKVKTADPFG